MLWPLLERLQRLLGVAVGERLDEVRVLSGAVHARHHVTVVAEEVEALVRVQQQLVAAVALLPGIGDDGVRKTVSWCECMDNARFRRKVPIQMNLNGIVLIEIPHNQRIYSALLMANSQRC